MLSNKLEDLAKHLRSAISGDSPRVGMALAAQELDRIVETLTVVPYELGREYKTQGGDIVKFITVSHKGTSYETMGDEQGVYRYVARDFGRVCGSAHDYSEPRNVPPHYYLKTGTMI
jgi:hypothetical protein